MVRAAILDDYQNVAMGLADWSPIAKDVEIKVFNKPFGSQDEAIKALQGFAIVVGMAEDFLKNPLSLFDIKGKAALITGATGSFGALAAKTLAAAGANVVLAAGRADELKKVAVECEKLGAKVAAVATRPNSESACDKIAQAAIDAFGRIDILVLASGINKVQKIVEQKPEDFLEVMDVNVTQSWR